MPLGARAWLADGVRGALVAADGTIDWYGPLRADQAPWYWRILDPDGGALRVGPVRAGRGAARRLPPHEQSYRRGTNVAELIIGDEHGRVRVVDALPWPGPNEAPAGRLVRVVTALSGPVDLEVEVAPSGPFRPAREVSAREEGIVVDGLAVQAGMPLRAQALDRERAVWRGVRRLAEGETVVVTVDDDVRRPPLSADTGRDLVARSEGAWRSWVWGALVEGPYAAAVERSLLAVRGLTGNDIGSALSAGTTSLPRRPGGERTADGRHIRWSDAASAAATLAAVGLAEDAAAAEDWLRRAAMEADLPWTSALEPDGSPLPEREELGLQGWRRSQPVVVGKDLPGPPGAVEMDLYGDVLSAVRPGNSVAAAWPALAAAADWVADHWQESDRGAWGLAGAKPERLVTSVLQAWFALSRMATVGSQPARSAGGRVAADRCGSPGMDRTRGRGGRRRLAADGDRRWRRRRPATGGVARTVASRAPRCGGDRRSGPPAARVWPPRVPLRRVRR